MTYRLVGMVSLDGPTLGSSTFLIPFFRSTRSNQLFAQELNSASDIIAFRVFEPYDYDVLPYIGPEIEREVEQQGILAYFRPTTGIQVAPVDRVRRELAASNLSKDKSPLFEMDVYALTGATHRVMSAVNSAAKLFGDGLIAEHWAATEKELIQSRGPPNAQRDSETVRLLGEYEDPAWVDRWERLWGQHSHAPEIAKLGLRYAKDTLPDRELRGKVLDAIVRDGRYAGEDSVQAIAREWLLKGATSSTPSLRWAQVWARMTNAGLTVSDDMARAAASYLQAALVDGSRDSTIWVTVWSTLWKVRFDRNRLISLSGGAMRAFGNTSRVTSTILARLRAGDGGEEAATVVRKWLGETRSPTRLWADTFLIILPMTSDPNRLAELLALGWEFLRDEPGHLKRWPVVFHRLRTFDPGYCDILVVAKDWLLRANQEIAEWPSIAMYVMENGPDAEVIGTVTAWLRNHPTAGRAWELRLKLQSVRELRLP